MLGGTYGLRYLGTWHGHHRRHVADHWTRSWLLLGRKRSKATGNTAHGVGRAANGRATVFVGAASGYDFSRERLVSMTIPIKNAQSVMSIPKIFDVITKTLVKHKARHITFSYEAERIVALEFALDIN